MTDIVIVSAARTPVGSFNGAFAAVPAHELGKTAITAALQRAKVDAKEVSEVVLGQVLTANQGMNPARQAARAAGVPDESPAWSLNQVCGSGLRAVVTASQQIKAMRPSSLRADRRACRCRRTPRTCAPARRWGRSSFPTR
jgi:acetyl-CoA C-acetyltransferase